MSPAAPKLGRSVQSVSEERWGHVLVAALGLKGDVRLGHGTTAGIVGLAASAVVRALVGEMWFVYPIDSWSQRCWPRCCVYSLLLVRCLHCLPLLEEPRLLQEPRAHLVVRTFASGLLHGYLRCHRSEVVQGT